MTPAHPEGATADVAVVGAGPVGLLLAVLLGRRGWRVEVLERQGRPYGLPRAVHLDHEAGRVLQSAGIMDELAPRTEAMDAYEWRSADGRTLLRLEGARTGPSGWPTSMMFCQPDLEAVLEAEARRIATVDVRRGHRVTSVDDRGRGAEVTAAVTGAGSSRSVKTAASWVVGCDGAASPTRGAIGGAMTDLGYMHRWFVVDVVTTAGEWRPCNVQSCDPNRPTTAVSGGPGRRRFEFMQLPGETVEDFDVPDTVWRLLGPWGLSPGNATIERQATYTYGARLADPWRRGRLLVAGDAAHQMPPFAGQGLCSGIRDAANLAWKLDLVLRGAAPDAILDTYQTERRPQVQAEIEFSIELGRIICVLDPAAAAARDEEMTAAARATGGIGLPPAPPLGPGVTLPGDPHAGVLGSQGRVSSLEREGRFDDVAGDGWVLLVRDRGPVGLPAPLARWWAGLGGRTVRVVAAHPRPGDGIDPGATIVADDDGTYAAWFDELGAVAVLQRPDFHVFGTAATPGAVSGLVGAARNALGAVR